MGVWSKLFGDKAEDPRGGGARSLTAPNPGAPTVVAAIPGKLAVTFYAHDRVEGAEGSFLTGVTQGLPARGQQELVLTLKLGAADDAVEKMREILRFFASVGGQASQGWIVQAGSVTRFGARALFGLSGTGLAYVDARPIAGVVIPRHALAAIWVHGDEAAAALEHGAYRVLTRVGEQFEHFPYPTWSELGRPCVATELDKESQLSKVMCAKAGGVSFLLVDKRLCLQLPRGMKRVLADMAKALPKIAPFALLMKPSADANAVLVWHPGQPGSRAISPAGSDGSRLSGSCLLVVRGADKDRAALFEDGYSLRLSGDSWESVFGALLAEQPLSISMADGMSFELQWSSAALRG